MAERRSATAVVGGEKQRECHHNPERSARSTYVTGDGHLQSGGDGPRKKAL
jgi:hypothetical protein